MVLVFDEYFYACFDFYIQRGPLMVVIAHYIRVFPNFQQHIETPEVFQLTDCIA